MHSNKNSSQANRHPLSSAGIAAPLKNAVFRRLWIANFISNLGGIMQGVAASWLMTSLTHSPLLIGLVLTALNLPIFLLGVPSGVLADLLNRRRLLMVAQLLMMAVSLMMVLFSGLKWMTAGELLFFIFLLGVGASLHLPAWMALLQDLVAQEHLAAAVSLNSIGFNLARTLGPALGGFCVHIVGVPLAFLSDALSYLAVLFSLVKIPKNQLPPPPTQKATPKIFFHSLREMWQFAITSPILFGILLRLALFTIGNAGVLALLPFIVREHLHLSVNNYGAFLSCFGIGSVLGALFLPRLRHYFSTDTIVGSGIFISVCSMLCLAYSQTIWIIALSMGFFGVAWIIVLVNYNVSIQLAAPAYIKGRMISLFVVIFQGGIGFGSALGGGLANILGYQRSLVIGACIVSASLALIPFFPLHREAD